MTEDHLQHRNGCFIQDSPLSSSLADPHPALAAAIICRPLENGLKLKLKNGSTHYFGGYFHVTVYASCDVPLDAAFFASEAEYLYFLARLGATIRFEKTLERMAVPESEIEVTHKQLSDTFLSTALPYLAAADFARNFVNREADKILRPLLPPHIRPV